MYAVVQLATSLRRDEVDKIDRMTVSLGKSRWRRAGTLRAMLRFAIEREDEFIEWMRTEHERPYVGPDGEA